MRRCARILRWVDERTRGYPLNLIKEHDHWMLGRPPHPLSLSPTILVVLVLRSRRLLAHTIANEFRAPITVVVVANLQTNSHDIAI
jgi:hypothetical protein